MADQRHPTMADIADWVPETTGHHWRTAERSGGESRPIFVIFHGKVDEDGDGPAGVCSPITPTDAQRAGIADVTTRTEPTHRRGRFPDRHGPGRALADPRGLRRRRHGGPPARRGHGRVPREVYVDDLTNATPDEEFRDIVLPIAM